MHFSKLAALLPVVAAMPLESRQASLSATDIAVVTFAHYLEDLEATFYHGGCNNYTKEQYISAGYPDTYRDNICLTADQEDTHRAVLASVLQSAGKAPLPLCEYNFPYNSPGTFAALANLITTVGIGAYLGGASLIMDNPDLLTNAAAILSVESRHNAFIRAGLKSLAAPSPFDTALPALWAYNLAHTFITRCPQELPNPPFVLLPKLQLTAPSDSNAIPDPVAQQKPLASGTQLSFKWDPSTFFVAVDANAPLYIALINQNAAPVYQQLTKTGAGSGTINLPQGLGNAAFAVLTTFAGGLNATELANYGTLAGPQIVLVS